MLYKLNQFLLKATIVVAIFSVCLSMHDIATNYNKVHLNNAIYLTFVSVNNSGGGSVIKSWYDASNNKKYAYVLTAAHVIKEPGEPIPPKVPGSFVQNKNGLIYKTEGIVEEFNEEKDICILKYELDYISRHVFCNLSENSLLDKVYSVGMPNSSFWVTVGTVASTFSKGYISHNAPGFYGNSGGPLFNYNGEQIGMNLMVGKAPNTSSPIPNINYAISIKEIATILGPEKFNKYFGRNV